LLIREIPRLRAAVASTRRERPFRIDAMVILPDHLHAVWALPAGDGDISRRWSVIKGRFSRGLPKSDTRSPSKRAKRERGIWQRRFWDHLIRDEADWRAHVAYCWANPVKHGLVEHPADWPYSSLHRDLATGQAGPEWRRPTPR
ncbi:MAG: transposase, partial [Pseudomonadota bacterium]